MSVVKNFEQQPLKNTVFEHNESGQIHSMAELVATATLNSRIYYSPGYFPSVSYLDNRAGSVFAGYTVPTAAFSFDQTGSQTTKTKLITPNSILLNDYIDLLYSKVRAEVIKIYDLHQEVVLMYSGGIDAITVLSFIIKLGLLSRTKLVIVYNYARPNNSDNILIADKQKQYAINDAVELLTSDGVKETSTINITEDDLIGLFNQNADYPHVTSYCTSLILQQYKNTAFIYGWSGNQTLLHKSIFIDQLLLHATDKEYTKNLLTTLFESRDFYSSKLKKYNVNNDTLIPLDHQRLGGTKYRADFNLNTNKVYDPLEATIAECRMIDFRDMDPAVILDAQVAREVIHRNVGTKLDQYILNENTDDIDTNAGQVFSRKQLNTDILAIPDNLNHVEQEKNYLREQLSKDNIGINDLFAVKLLQFLSSVKQS